MASQFKNRGISFAEVALQGESVVNPTAVDVNRIGNPVLFVMLQAG
jgi:hypothetical protein